MIGDTFKEDGSDFSLPVQPLGNSSRPPVGAESDIRRVSPPCGKPQHAVVFNKTLAEASRE